MGIYEQDIYALNSIAVRSIFSVMVLGIIWAFACFKICEGKGYTVDESYREVGLGYLLGPIWLIVCAVKPIAERGRVIADKRNNSFPIFIIGLILSIIGILFLLISKSAWSCGLLIVYIGLVFLFFALSRA